MKKIKIKLYIEWLDEEVILEIEHLADYRQSEINDLVEKKIKDYLYNVVDFEVRDVTNE